MGAARSLHTATPLSNGTVMVVGGLGGRTPIAEIYDPAIGLWSATGAPSTTRVNHIAARLADGRVLIASGSDSSFTTTLSSAEIYDPGTGIWSAAANPSSLARVRARRCLPAASCW